jgi:hypothetical protein
MVDRISTHLAAIEAWFASLQHNGKPLVTAVRRQLDLVDAEDIDRLSFAAPGGFLVLPRFRLIARADGGRDCEIWIVLAIASKPAPGLTSDADVIARVISLATVIEGETFSQSECSDPVEVECRPVLTVNDGRGLSVAALSFRQVLYRVVAGPEAVAGLVGQIGAGGERAGNPQLLELDGLSQDEASIVSGWGGGIGG